MEMGRKSVLICVLLVCNLKLVSSQEKQVGWFARDRNYTDYCHGGDFESGASRALTSHHVCTVWISNESRCTLKYVGGGVEEEYGIPIGEAPRRILPNDCGVFWTQGPWWYKTSGIVHYMCEEYGVIIAIRWSMPFLQRSEYSTRLLYFNRQTDRQLLTVDHEAPATGYKASFNVFISETKRYCPCKDWSIYKSYNTICGFENCP